MILANCFLFVWKEFKVDEFNKSTACVCRVCVCVCRHLSSVALGMDNALLACHFGMPGCKERERLREREGLDLGPHSAKCTSGP